MSASIIDLSQVKPVKAEKKPDITITQLGEAIQKHKDTVIEAFNKRYEKMGEMSAAMQSKLAVLPGQPHPAQEIANHLKFLDVVLQQTGDMITAGEIILALNHNETLMTFMKQFPDILRDMEKAKHTVVSMTERQVNDCPPEEAIVIAAYRDLKRVAEVLGVTLK